MRGIPFESYHDAQPRILIGSDNPNLIFQVKGREGKFHEPIASKTRLGWSVYGGGTENDSFVAHHSVQICPCNEGSHAVLQQMVSDYFNLDSLGIYKSGKPLESNEDKRVR